MIVKVRVHFVKCELNHCSYGQATCTFKYPIEALRQVGCHCPILVPMVMYKCSLLVGYLLKIVIRILVDILDAIHGVFKLPNLICSCCLPYQVLQRHTIEVGVNIAY